MSYYITLSAGPGDVRQLTPINDVYVPTEFDVSGLEGALVTLNSSIPGTNVLLDLTDFGDQVINYGLVQDLCVIGGKIRVYNGIDGGNNVGVIFLPKTIYKSILNLQASSIENLILSMTQENGYNYNWSTTNQRNYALGTFPRAEIYSIEEENLDSLNGIGSLDYTNSVIWNITIAGKIEISSTNPVFDIFTMHNLALDDLKMLFGNPENRQLTGTCDSFLYKGFTREIKSVDQFIPSKLITKWRSVYSQDRQYPSIYAGS